LGGCQPANSDSRVESPFRGKARMRVKLVNRVIHLKDTVLEGAFYGWANPLGGVTTDGDYPFCFSAPDYRLHDKVRLPSEVTVQLAAFPNEILAFENQEAMRSSNTWMNQMAPESCIPSGLFLPGGGTIDPPKPQMMFCGTVQETSLGGELDVVVAQPLSRTRSKRTVLSGRCVGCPVGSSSFLFQRGYPRRLALCSDFLMITSPYRQNRC